MYTQCPSCATLFSLGPRHLREAQGLVRCCLCDETFDALETLSDRLPEGAEQELAPPVVAETAEKVVADPLGQASPEPKTPPEPVAVSSQPQPQTAGASPESQLQGGVEPEPAVNSEPEPIPAAAPTETADEPTLGPEPEAEPKVGPHRPEARADEVRDPRRELRAADPAATEHPDPLRELSLGASLDIEEPPVEPVEKRGWGGRLIWGFGSLLLIGLLLAQGAYLGRAELARYPEMRPALSLLCRGVGCELPLLRSPDKVQVLQSEVAAHPRQEGVLQVRAMLENRAAYPVAYPQLGLRFTDLQGQLVGQRWFEPSEYLAETRDGAVEAGMPPGAPVRVQLDLMDPGEQAANFQVDLR